MSENMNRGSRDFSRFDTMETEELEEILRLDAEAPEEEETDTELLLYIMEVLAERRKKANITGNNAQDAWKSFEENYMPENILETKSKPAPARWLRSVIAAAAVIALLILIPVSAKAMKLDELWNVVAKWAKETFSFVSGGDTNVDEPGPDRRDELTPLRELLEQRERDVTIVPTWIPEGFMLEKVEEDVTPIQEIYRARYLNGDKKIRIRVQTYLTDDFQKLEIEEGYSEIYTVAGIDYYIFENIEQNRAVWVTGIYECVISGDLSIDEIKRMIDSIEKG